MTNRQEEIAKIFAKLSKSLGKYPTRADLRKGGIPRDSIRDQFGNMDGLREAARKAYPQFFEDLVDPEFFNSEAFDHLKAEVKKHRKLFISTVVAGAPIDEEALASVNVWCRIQKGLALFLPANYALYDLQADFVANNHIVFKDLKLNSNLWISTIKIDPKQIDPTQNLDLIGQREGTMLIGSPKQRMKPVANSNTKLPHIIQATGAITKPRYIPRKGDPKRRDYLAQKQHVMGGIIVEIVDDKFYHFRQVQFDKDGSFIDAFYRYDDEGRTAVTAEAVVQGDFHDGETDPKADAVADELCRLGKPKYRVFHDTFNGHSISHHDKDQKVRQAIKANEHKLSLATELHNLKLTLQRKLKQSGKEKFLMVRSNHDEFLHRYLQKGDFEDQNRLIATKLQVQMMEGRDPLQAAMEMLGLSDERLVWIDRDQDFKISRARIEVGAHGDLGANGRRNPGSAGMLKAYGDCAYGHCHYGEINHGAWSVGTTSFLKLDYNRGPSSWTQTHQIIYSNGSRQLIHVIQGKWRLED
jgi:hypothetical protein